MSPNSAAVLLATPANDYELGGGGVGTDAWASNRTCIGEAPGGNKEVVQFVDDWSGLSEEDALLFSGGAPIAVPVGLEIDDGTLLYEDTQDVARIPGQVEAALWHLRFVEPLRAEAVRLRYGIAGEREHTVPGVAVRMEVSAETAARYIADGLGELRLRFALSQV